MFGIHRCATAILACLLLLATIATVRAESLKLVCPSGRGGVVKLEGVETGRCPGEIEVPAGTYKIEVIFESGASWTKTVTTSPDKPVLMFPVPTESPALAPDEAPPPLAPVPPEPEPAKDKPPACSDVARQLITQADLLVENKVLDKAIELFKTALVEDPLCVEAWHKLAMANAFSGNYQEAITLWNKVLELDPANEKAKHNILLAEKRMKQKAAEKPVEKPKPEPKPGAHLEFVGIVAAAGLHVTSEHLDQIEQVMRLTVPKRTPPAGAQSYAIQVTAFSSEMMICPADPEQAKVLNCPPEIPIVKVTLNLQLIYYSQPTTVTGTVVSVPLGTFSAPAPVEIVEAHEDPEKQKEAGLKAVARATAALSNKLASAPLAPESKPCPAAEIKPAEPVVDVPVSVVYEDPTLEKFPSMSDYGITYDLNLTLRHMTDLSFDGSTKYSMVYRRASESMTVSSAFKTGGNFNIAEGTDDTASLYIDGSAGPLADSGRFTNDFYLFSDLFVFLEGQVNARVEHGADDPEPTLAIFGGFGWGRTLPVATYFRVRDVLKVLHENRLLKRELTPDEIQRLMEVITNRWDGMGLCDAAIEELDKLGLLAKEPDRRVKRKIAETIMESYGYKEQGKDYRIGIHYNILKGEATLVSDLPQIGASWTMKIPWGKWFFEPMVASYIMIDPFVAAFIAGATLSYQPSLRSKFVLGELFLAALAEGGEYMMDTAYAEYRYWITNLINASLRASVTKVTDTDLDLQLSLNIGLATF